MDIKKTCLFYLLTTCSLMAAEDDVLRDSAPSSSSSPLSTAPTLEETDAVNRDLQSVQDDRELPFNLENKAQKDSLRLYLARANSQNRRVSLRLINATNEDLVKLSRFNCIKTLNLHGTQVAAEDEEQLRVQIPHLIIEGYD